MDPKRRPEINLRTRINSKLRESTSLLTTGNGRGDTTGTETGEDTLSRRSTSTPSYSLTRPDINNQPNVIDRSSALYLSSAVAHSARTVPQRISVTSTNIVVVIYFTGLGSGMSIMRRMKPSRAKAFLLKGRYILRSRDPMYIS